jgi:hypothetical protein
MHETTWRLTGGTSWRRPQFTCVMASPHIYFTDSFDPADLAVAVSTFETVTGFLGAAGTAHAVRERVADYIMQRMLLGERNAARLRDGTLAKLRVAPPL